MENKILIIDDDLESCKRIKYHLQNEWTDVYYATSVHDGLTQLMTCDYTILIMDVFLSETNGLLLLKEIHRMNTLPIIAISSKSDLAEKARAISSGADDFLVKPQGPEDLALYAAEPYQRAVLFHRFLWQSGHEYSAADGVLQRLSHEPHPQGIRHALAPRRKPRQGVHIRADIRAGLE